MTLTGKAKLQKLKEQHSDARSQIDSWIAEVENANWKGPHELKARYPQASVLGNQQVIFNVCGNKYRVWATVAYQTGIVIVRAAGTHKEYDKWEIE